MVPGDPASTPLVLLASVSPPDVQKQPHPFSGEEEAEDIRAVCAENVTPNSTVYPSFGNGLCACVSKIGRLVDHD